MTSQDKFQEYQTHEELEETCLTHGVSLWKIFPPKREIAPFCPVCMQEIIDNEVQAATKQALDGLEEVETYQVLERDSIIPSELKNATFQTFRAQTKQEQEFVNAMKRYTKEYLEGRKGNLVISGDTGIGKSHLALSLARGLNEAFRGQEEPKSILFVTFSDMVSQIQNGWQYGKGASMTEQEAIEKLTRVDFLILDDLGAKNAVLKPKSDWEQDFLFKVLNARDITIVTTNLTMEELRQIYNSRNHSRLSKGLVGHLLNLENIKDKRPTQNSPQATRTPLFERLAHGVADNTRERKRG